MPGKVSSTVSSARHPLLCTGTAALGRQHESDYRSGRRGGPAVKTLEHFFPAQIFSAIQFTEPPHTQLHSSTTEGLPPHLGTAGSDRRGSRTMPPPAPHLLPPAQTDPRENPHTPAKRETVFHQFILPECNGVCSKEGLDLCRGNSKSKWLGERRHRTTPPAVA